MLYLSRGAESADRTLQRALKERLRAGLPEPPIRIVRTPHRYIAGESSAVVNRASGGPAKPKFTLQRTAEKGVNDRPTLIQNAETLAHVGMIARYGSDWFRKVGTDSSPGSTLMTVCGNVQRPGVYEVDLGARLGGVLAAAGGTSSPAGGALLGGYFGTWLPPNLLRDLPLDVDGLRSAHGASLGCGVLAVLPSSGCGVVEATRIFSYLAAETAGQCGPCVNGLAAIAETMERVAVSQTGPGDLERVRRWVDMVRGRGRLPPPGRRGGPAGQRADGIQRSPQSAPLWAAVRWNRCGWLSTATGSGTGVAVNDDIRRRMRVNPVLCDGYGYCAEIVPEIVTLDDWGFPIVHSDSIDDGRVLNLAERALATCPRLAILLEDVTPDSH